MNTLPWLAFTIFPSPNKPREILYFYTTYFSTHVNWERVVGVVTLCEANVTMSANAGWYW